MSGELVRYEPEDQAVAYPTDPTGGRLVAWAEGLQAAHQLGKALCMTSFVPRHFANKPEETAAAILFGDEIGLSPTQAIRGIYVVSGTPAMYARTMVALVMSHGHEVWTEEDTPQKVTVSGRRKGSNRVETVTWTTSRARQAGYTSNRRYEQDPQGMLYARASADVARRVAPDVLAGVAYTVEEMELDSSAPVAVRSHTQPAVKRTAKRAELPPPRPAEPEEPELEDRAPATEEPTPEPPGWEKEPPAEEVEGQQELPPPDQPADGPELITRPQLRMMHASFRTAGIEDQAERHAFASGVVGRDIAGSEELTKAEASAVIDALAAETGDSGDDT